MKILLSPAKALDFETEVEIEGATRPILLEDTNKLLKKLKKTSGKQLATLMSLSPKLAELNYDRYQSFDEEHSNNLKPAAFAFNGEVYNGLSIEEFSAEELKRANDQIRILSGLYGVLKPCDNIQPYRLEMGTKFAVGRKKNLYEFWDTRIADRLNEEEGEGGLIVNLASNEYFKAAKEKALKPRIITCEFKEFKNGAYKTVMVYAKKARGFMAAWIVKQDIQNPEDIKGFDVEGYAFNSELSEGDKWVFTR